MKMSIIHKAVYRFNTVPMKIPMPYPQTWNELL